MVKLSVGDRVKDIADNMAQLESGDMEVSFRRDIPLCIERVDRATGELTADDAVAIAYRDLKAGLPDTLDVEAGLREVLATDRDPQS